MEEGFSFQINIEGEVQLSVEIGFGDESNNTLNKFRLTCSNDIPKIRSSDPQFAIYMTERYGISWTKKASYQFQCLICGIIKNSPIKIFEHIMKDHVQKRLYECSVCGKTYLSNPSLHQHMTRVHYKKNQFLKFIDESKY